MQISLRKHRKRAAAKILQQVIVATSSGRAQTNLTIRGTKWLLRNVTHIFTDSGTKILSSKEKCYPAPGAVKNNKNRIQDLLHLTA